MTARKRKRKSKAEDAMMTVAVGLATLIASKKFSPLEADNVSEAFAILVATVEASAKHAERIAHLEKKLEALEAKATPKLRAVAS